MTYIDRDGMAATTVVASHYLSFIEMEMKSLCVSRLYNIFPLKEQSDMMFRYMDSRWKYLPHEFDITGCIPKPYINNMGNIIVHECNCKIKHQ